jgi:hypothetical protein
MNTVFKNILTVCFLLLSTYSNCQKNGINLINLSSNERVFISDNNRIKIVTIDNQKLSGKFSVIDKKFIQIEANKIDIQNVTKLKKTSFWRTISSPFSKVGAFFLTSVFQINSSKKEYFLKQNWEFQIAK